MKIQLEINGFDDRRNLAAILADNGYKVRINEVEGNTFFEGNTFCGKRFIVEIEREDKKNEP